jgi:hypothetical protein
MKERLTLLALIVIDLFVLTPHSYAQKDGIDAGYRGARYSFRQYSPKDIRKLNEIRNPILSLMISQMKNRLGKHFYHRVRFDWGEAIDLNELYRVEPYWKTEDVGNYDLVFHFSDRSKGLKSFYFKILFDAEGKIMDMSLPELNAQPQKSNLISVKQATAVALKANFLSQNVSAFFDYDRSAGSFIWIITDRAAVTERGICKNGEDMVLNGHGPWRQIIIEAHTGRILKKHCYNFLV